MDPLPSGWAEHVDPGTGNKFYHNAGTGETSWERPKPPAAAASALPSGWTEHLDAASGKTFFYNASTGQTSWDRPQAQAAQPDALPEGWTEHLDPGSGRTFYHKAATGETSWERPQAAQAAAAAAPVEEPFRSLGGFLDEVKAAQREFTQNEEDAINAVVMQYDMTFKQNATQTFAAISAVRNQLLPKVQLQESLPPDLLGALNTAVQACELRYGMARTDTIPHNLMMAQPGGKLYPGLVKKVETLCNKTVEDLEQREKDAFKNRLLKGNDNPGFDAQKAALETRLKESKQALSQKYAQILSQSDHMPVYKSVPAGATSLSLMTWNVMEFPRMGQTSNLVLDGLVPMADLVVKNLSRGKEDRQVLLDALCSETVVSQHTVQMLTTISESLEARGMDAVLLQELGTDTQAQITQLCQQKGWDACFSTGNEDPMKCDAITGIVSKRPFDEKSQVEVVENKKSRRFAAARLGTAWLVSCHIPLGTQTTEEAKQDVGSRMVQEISQRYVQHGQGMMLIVGGDWNADVNGVKNRLSLNMPYGSSQLTVHTDAKTCVGAAFPADGIVCLQ